VFTSGAVVIPVKPALFDKPDDELDPFELDPVRWPLDPPLAEPCDPVDPGLWPNWVPTIDPAATPRSAGVPVARL
jgi:hypothetical protein